MSEAGKRVLVGPYGMVPVALHFEEGLRMQHLRVYTSVSSFQGCSEECFPGLEKIAERAGINKYACSEAASWLVERGWLLRRRRGTGKTNLYCCLTEVAPPPGLPEADLTPGAKPDLTPGATVELTPGANSLKDLPERPPEKTNTPASPREGKKTSVFREVTDHFTMLFREYYHGERSPDWGAKQAGLVKKDLLRVNGSARVLKVAQELFFDDDIRRVKEFCAEAGREYAVFHGMLGAILEYMRRQEEAGRADW